MHSSLAPFSRRLATTALTCGLAAAPARARSDALPAESPLSAGLEAGLAYVTLLSRPPADQGDEAPADRVGLGAFAAASASYEASRRVVLEAFLPTSFPEIAPGDPGLGLDYALGATPRRLDHAFASIAVPSSAESSAEHRLTSLTVGGGAAFLRPEWTFGASASATLEAYRRDAPGRDRERWRAGISSDVTRAAGDVQVGAGGGVSLVELERGAPFFELEVTLVEVSLALRPRPRAPRRP